MLYCFFNALRATACILSLSVIGCAVPQTQIPSSRFQENIDASGALIGSYLVEISDFDRRTYLDEVLDIAKKPRTYSDKVLEAAKKPAKRK